MPHLQFARGAKGKMALQITNGLDWYVHICALTSDRACNAQKCQNNSPRPLSYDLSSFADLQATVQPEQT